MLIRFFILVLSLGLVAGIVVGWPLAPVAIVILGLRTALCVGLLGWALQRSIATQALWRALFGVFALLTAFAVVVAVGFYAMVPTTTLPSMGAVFLEGGAFFAHLLSLAGLYAYAYRSKHLWPSSVVAGNV